MKVDSNFVLRNIADTWVVVPTGANTVDFSKLMHLSESAAFLWGKLQVDTTRDDLLTDLIAEYEIDRDVAESDLEDFLNSLNELDILL